MADRRPGREWWIEFELQDRDAPDGEVYLARARPFVLLDGLNLLVEREVRELVRTRDMVINAVIWEARTLRQHWRGIAMSRSTTRRMEISTKPAAKSLTAR